MLAAAQAMRFGATRHVLAMAGSPGYRHERMIFCREQTLTGSRIEVARCSDAAHLPFRVKRATRPARADGAGTRRHPTIR